MFENVIEFSSDKIIIENNKDILPEPAKLHIPDWFKKLEHSVENPTVKGCMPFLDTLVTGYILKMPIDYGIEHNVEVEGEKKTGMRSSAGAIDNLPSVINLNYNGTQNFHGQHQLTGCPYLEKNNNLPIHKILNPFIIKTPPGYSCLFVPPLNNTDDRFSIISGIVDTDTYEQEINFPFVINGEKYEVLKTVLKRGTPYVQIIPFKREKWKMKIKTEKREKIITSKFNFRKYLINNYKRSFWFKKSWK